MTRFSPGDLDFKTTLELVIHCSFSLEYLELFFVKDYNEEEHPITWLMKDFELPKLRHLAVNACPIFADDEPRQWESFPWTVAKIMGASPKVDTLEIDTSKHRMTINGVEVEIANLVLLQVDISNLMTLKLRGLIMDHATLEQIVSVPFSKLQNLRMTDFCKYQPGRGGLIIAPAIVFAFVAAAAETLTKLDLLDAELDYDFLQDEFPVCPNVQELYLQLHVDWDSFVSQCFPSLQSFCGSMCSADGEEGDIFRETSVFAGVKTYKHVDDCEFTEEFFYHPNQIFTTFPELEWLSIDQSFLYEHMHIKNISGPEFVDLLQGLRHLELEGSLCDWFKPTTDGSGHSLFAELKGIQTLTVDTKLSEITQMPIPEMTSLKVLRIQWRGIKNLKMKKLLKIAKQVEKVVITNCCSVLREEKSHQAKDLLKEFFDALLNASCGCKEQGIMKLRW